MPVLLVLNPATGLRLVVVRTMRLFIYRVLLRLYVPCDLVRLLLHYFIVGSFEEIRNS